MKIQVFLIFLVFGCSALASSSIENCEYGKPNTCDENKFCINVDKNKTECRANPDVKLLSVRFPFQSQVKVECDQGTLSPTGNSHIWLNTAFALDLQSDQSLSDVPVVAGAKGKVIAFSDCQTENDQCGLGFGNSVKILTDEGYLVFYAHLKRVLVKTDERVALGQKIGIEGMTGWTGKNNRHLHMSVHYDWRTSGFEYWKQTGFLPASMPYRITMCEQPCTKNCKESDIDVRTIKCKRTSDVVAALCTK